ncbi:magnesium transporter, partial [Burkholderia multivorans]
VFLTPETTVAEALAHVRREDLSAALAAVVFVCRQPIETPTGKFLGIVHIQEMLRHPPHEAVGIMLDTEVDAMPPDTSLAEVTNLLAAYNLVSVPITDDNDRLIGVVTVDDVLDELLP